MNAGNFNKSGRRKRVLVSPLDWGLGHATRCIPIIRELISNDCEVILAAEAAGMHLLQLEFPQLEALELKGYHIKYRIGRKGFHLKIILQIPKIFRTIWLEHRWLKKTVLEKGIDLIISDNRFGLYHSSVPCIYVTHQLTIKTGNSFTERIIQRLHYHFIHKYSACWVPDAAGEQNLAGELSHPARMPKTPVHYIGPLSRFEKYPADKKYDLAIILSGPEPQRTVFEDRLLSELAQYKGFCIFIRGLPGNSKTKKTGNPNIEIHDHLPAFELNKAILQSTLVISRSGYTTVMDLVKLQQQALLIPTPGQSEQEYLGRYLSGCRYFYKNEQEDFSLSSIEYLNTLPLPTLPQFPEQFKQVIHHITIISPPQTEVPSVKSH